MIRLLLSLGVRRGELCGLKWSDINFFASTININRNLLYLPEKGIFEDTPKTPKSKREISVTSNELQMLNSHRAYQFKRQLELGDAWIETDYIFTSWNGSALHPDTISSWFKKLIKKYDLPDISIHSLRNTNATMLLMNGLPVKAVSSRLGHSNAVTTSNIYSHALKSVDEEAATVIDNILSNGNKQDKKGAVYKTTSYLFI